jgi:hypothetical protein
VAGMLILCGLCIGPEDKPLAQTGLYTQGGRIKLCPYYCSPLDRDN